MKTVCGVRADLEPSRHLVVSIKMWSPGAYMTPLLLAHTHIHHYSLALLSFPRMTGKNLTNLPVEKGYNGNGASMAKGSQSTHKTSKSL